MRRDLASLIGLDRPYKVPDEWQVLQFANLMQRFLQIVLPEMQQAAGVSLPHLQRGPCLAHGNHKNVTIAILAFLCAAPYSLEQLCYIVGEQLFVHGANVSGFGEWAT